MRIWNGFGRYPQEHSKVVASIGNYDGVHIGHQAILRQAIEDARARNLPSLLITFEPHPLAVVAPERKPRLLQTRRQKLDSLDPTGLTDLLIVEFTPEIAALDGEQFFARMAGAGVELAAVHVGENFRFGHRRAGDAALLARLGESGGFEVHVVPPVRHEGQVASSSMIREAVAGGDVELARGLLGRPYELAGHVVRGEGRGRKLSYPTANLRTDNEVIPANGVYITEAVALACRSASVTNVGTRPTFLETNRTVETHLLGFDGDLYDERVALRFLARIRDEIRFSSASDLADQIARDRAAAESYFQNLHIHTT